MYQVLCTLSNEASDVRCAVCGQGFLVYWARYSRAEQAECRQKVKEHLRNHHIFAHDPGADRRIHPRNPFTVPEWPGLPDAADSLLTVDDHS